jgi:ABC-type Zn uptake system ZnuABC Zn-binding protein ZnuA
MARLAFVLALFVTAAGTVAAQERLRIVATTSDLRSLAKAVGGEAVIVSSIVPPGERAENYVAKVQDVAILKNARLVVRAGSGIDGWFDKLLARTVAKNEASGIERGQPGHLDASLALAPTDPLAVTAGFSPRPRVRGGASPHYWLDPRSAETITGEMLKVFSTLDPANAVYYENNRRTFLDRLSVKLREWSSKLVPLQGRPILAFHDDWSFFARRFGLNIVDYIATRDRAAPRRKKLKDLVQLIKERDIRLIISEARQPERHARRLADQTGATLVELAGSVGMLPDTGDYIAMFDANVNALVAAGSKI